MPGGFLDRSRTENCRFDNFLNSENFFEVIFRYSRIAKLHKQVRHADFKTRKLHFGMLQHLNE
jgi:hypothetical protein